MASLDFVLQKFWEIEQIPNCQVIFTPDEIKCEEIFKKYAARDESGRFVVPLPFRSENPHFGDTYSQALRRFTYLENKLHKNPELFLSFAKFIQEYIDLNYISTVPDSEYQSSSSFYLPYHGIFKPDSVSTKLRIVFDASAKGTNGLSLNDTLLPGPKLHQDLTSILLKFRLFPVVFTCDIKQMYCQILVKPEHRTFQRFLWRFLKTDPVKEFTLNRVTFGVSSAPYLALRVIKALALLEKDRFPEASQVLQDSVYIDDCVCGAESVDAA